jgi:TolB protein
MNKSVATFVVLVLASCTTSRSTSQVTAEVAAVASVRASIPTSGFAECGKQLAFSSNRDGNYEIYVANYDGSKPKNLTRNPADDGSPFYSPDGKSIAFWSDRDGDYYNQDIVIMKNDGTNLLNVSKQSVKLKSGSYIYWSSDSKRIATLQNFEKIVIFTINPITLELINTEIVGGSEFNENEWFTPIHNHKSESSNGKCIAYSDGQPPHMQIFIRNQVSVVNITNDTSNNVSPTWQP